MEPQLMSKDTSYLIRALVKMSSALTDIDGLSDDAPKVFKHKLKKDLNTFESYCKSVINPIMKDLMEVNEKQYIEMLMLFCDAGDNILLKRDLAGTHILRFYIKVISLRKDLIKISSINTPDAVYPKMMYTMTNIFTIEYFNKFGLLLGIDKSKIENLVSTIDEIGEKINFIQTVDDL